LKRIAIQYSGEVRNFLDCFNNHYEYLILKNPDYQVDIFAHLWDSPYENKKDRITKVINPTEIVFEEQINFNNKFIYKDADKGWFFNMASMFYGIEAANNIRKSYEDQHGITYDYVIRMRTDTLFIYDSIQSIDHYEKDFLHLKEYTPFDEYSISDYFAIGGPEVMNVYSSVYSNLQNMIDAGASVIPESLIGFNIKDLPIKKHNFRMWIYKYIMMELSKVSNQAMG
jgi:hypothetical protein